MQSRQRASAEALFPELSNTGEVFSPPDELNNVGGVLLLPDALDSDARRGLAAKDTRLPAGAWPPALLKSP
jgi:hypothetical protein